MSVGLGGREEKKKKKKEQQKKKKREMIILKSESKPDKSEIYIYKTKCKKFDNDDDKKYGSDTR